MTLHTQFMTMGAMIIGGVYVGFANETFRRLAPLWQSVHFFRYSFEILFWLVQTALLYYVLYTINYGELRLYLFVAFISGFLIYITLFQRMYQKTLNVIIHIVKQIGMILYRIGIVPIIFIVTSLYTLMTSIIRMTFKITRFFLYHIIVLPIKWLLPKKISNFISQTYRLYSTMIGKRCKQLLTFFRK